MTRKFSPGLTILFPHDDRLIAWTCMQNPGTPYGRVEGQGTEPFYFYAHVDFDPQ